MYVDVYFEISGNPSNTTLWKIRSVTQICKMYYFTFKKEITEYKSRKARI